MDDLCLARALVVSIARIEKDPRYAQIKNSNRPVQRERAFDLHEAANVPLGPCGLNKVDLFQQHLTNYQIIVVSETRTTLSYTQPNPQPILILKNPSTYIIRLTILMSLPVSLVS